MLASIKAIISKHLVKRSAISMWEKRAKTYGKRAVLHIGHSDEEMDAITQLQKDKIFPYLRQNLLGNERTILDLGCGPGRFTPDLAAVIHGKAIGVDPIQRFIDMAPKSETVEYRVMEKGSIPVDDQLIDVVWICLVLGGITERKDLSAMIAEVERVLVPGGLLCLIENTSDKHDGAYWKFRSVLEYGALFPFIELNHCADYTDLGERISIMAGRNSR